MKEHTLSKTASMAFVFCAATAIPSLAQTFTTLVSFNGTNGEDPRGSLVQGTDGNFYGTTGFGGANNVSACAAFGLTGCGTVFKITTSGMTTLYTFCAQAGCTDGATHQAALIKGGDGNLYGTTSQGGTSKNCTSGCGTVFTITSSGVLTTLHSFNGADGSLLSAGLVQIADGSLYGTTPNGGPVNW